MIILGALVAVWGGLVLALAKPLHVRWKGMLAEMTRAGVRNGLPGIAFFASTAGLRRMRIAGALALAIGVGMIVAGALWGGGV